MLRNKDFEEYISQLTFKGLLCRNRRIEISRSLSAHTLQLITSEAINKFGYTSEAEAKADINRIYSTLCGGSVEAESVSRIDFRQIVPGSSLILVHDGGWALHTIYSSRGTLIVICDSEQVLIPGDEMNPLQLEIRCGQDARFQIARDGARYPSCDLYFNLSDITSIQILKNTGYVPSYKSKNNIQAIRGINDIYALRGDISGRWFDTRDFTLESNEALFKICFLQNTIIYSFNDNYKPDFDNLTGIALIEKKENLLEDIFRICNVSDVYGNIIEPSVKDVHNLRHIHNLRPGTLKLGSGNNRLMVISKAALRI